MAIVLVQVLLFFRVRFVLVSVVLSIVVGGLMTVILVQVLLFLRVRLVLVSVVLGIVVGGLVTVILVQVFLLCSVFVSRSGFVLLGLMMGSTSLGGILVVGITFLFLGFLTVLVGLVVQLVDASVWIEVTLVMIHRSRCIVFMRIVDVSSMERRGISNVTVGRSDNTIRMVDDMMVNIDDMMVDIDDVMVGISLSPFFMAVGFGIVRGAVRSCVSMMRHYGGNSMMILVCGVLRGDVVGILMRDWHVITLVVALEMMSDWTIWGECRMDRRRVGCAMVLLVDRLMIVARSIGVSHDVMIHGTWHMAYPVLTIRGTIRVSINSIGVVVNSIAVVNSIGVGTIVISVVRTVMDDVLVFLLFGGDSDSDNGSKSERSHF